MDKNKLRRLRRRAFWIGVRSVFDLSGQRTLRDMRKLAAEAQLPQPPYTWTLPTVSSMTLSTGKPPPGTHIYYC